MMLTDAQYKALKAWPDGIVAVITPRGMTTKHGIGICGISTFSKLFRDRLVSASDIGTITKVQPACDDAIREYEAAQPKIKTPKGENSGIEN